MFFMGKVICVCIAVWYLVTFILSIVELLSLEAKNNHLLRSETARLQTLHLQTSDDEAIAKRLQHKYEKVKNLKDGIWLKRGTKKPSVTVSDQSGINSSLVAFIRSDADSEEFAKNKLHDFNVFLSDRMPLDRSLPDVRSAGCKNVVYSELSKTVSVIICFHNEARSVLLRTVASVVNRSPGNLLVEILLIDDFSAKEFIGGDLLDVLRAVSAKIHLIRLEKREGLIRARVAGARQANGDVLFFMDSHCEVNEGWMEPLVAAIQDNHSTVICPTIDIIHSDSFEYAPSPHVRGGFNWGLHFRWESLPNANSEGEIIHPFRSAAMAGGLFAIHRHYFRQIGEYDTGMDIWGGENIELSLRIWLCGGTLLISPCSRVGHIFRHRRPYGNDGKGDTQLTNSLRLARVWLGDYIDKFYDARPEARQLDAGDISSRVQLKSDLHCRSFQWFVDNIYPEALSPSGAVIEKPQLSFTGKFQLRHVHTGKCIGTESLVRDDPAALVDCDKDGKRALIYEEKQSRALVLGRKLCLEAADVPRLGKCHYSGQEQAWVYSKNQRHTSIMSVVKALCLGVRNDRLEFIRCNDESQLLLWQIVQ
ncbi:inactive polypeptide N-acetylgalactosaminyltransferase-like protein 5 [Paramacrobiotus metropolitanus]|uniref:inactive polypeptide N-acetylgalactosaminyltransferase-like protein 5 n=1 Tax=Paramacrobiotus metropolitanus TaxID=2943436 RepID=UPI0024464871|nr:inactive polypeptide N-acetylgalactosaminyltransferase-like protein 5 [Paramacrobiotus metropolitanus]